MSVRSQKLLSKIRSMRSTLSMRGGPGSGRHPGSAMSEEEYATNKDAPKPGLKAVLQKMREDRFAQEDANAITDTYPTMTYEEKKAMHDQFNQMTPKQQKAAQNKYGETKIERPASWISQGETKPHPGSFKRPAFTPKMKVSKKVGV